METTLQCFWIPEKFLLNQLVGSYDGPNWELSNYSFINWFLGPQGLGMYYPTKSTNICRLTNWLDFIVSKWKKEWEKLKGKKIVEVEGIDFTDDKDSLS